MGRPETWTEWWNRLHQWFHEHAQCYAYDPIFVFTKTIADQGIWFDYVAISAGCLYIALQLRDKLPFSWLGFWFAMFIFTCGLTHQTDVLTMYSTWWFFPDLIVRVVCFVSSTMTAILFLLAIPKIVAFVNASWRYLRLQEKVQAFDSLIDSALALAEARTGDDRAAVLDMIREVMDELRSSQVTTNAG